jgi:NitT/TauT family transport system permease protein
VSATESAGRRRYRFIISQIIVWTVLLGLWQLSTYLFDSQNNTSGPTLVARRVVKWQRDGVLWSATWYTLKATLFGFGFGTVGGAVSGFVLGRSRRLGPLLNPVAIALYSVPKITLGPLFVIWFGIGLQMKTMMAASLVFFFVFFTTYNGTRRIDEDLVLHARIMGASKFQILRRIVLPQAAVWVFTGIRLSLPYALIGAVVGEFIASTDGLGYLANTSSQVFDTTGVFTALTVLTVLALLLNGVVMIFERLLMPWESREESLPVPAA